MSFEGPVSGHGRLSEKRASFPVRRTPPSAYTRRPPSAARLAHDSLNLWKDVLLRTREEIDLEKTEGTRMLHLKLILIGALLVIVPGPAGPVVLLLLPLVMVAMDTMQASRLEYILHRWRYLTEAVVPRIRVHLAAPEARFFEEDVVERTKDCYYHRTECFVRTLLILPALLLSSISAALLCSRLLQVIRGNPFLPYPYITGALWLTGVTLLARSAPHRLYLWSAILVSSLSLVALYALDWLVLKGAGLQLLLDLIGWGV